ncbi:hypothetical protein BCR37DRAFT_386424 [Protomyces lactucae-debilis]|uniref:Trafficking protein particle complex subunit 10 n=1 Tax=Protomyces lactucae-debilis TaxID=2754530 RepID=A0A1Y2FLY3_PROLT|nr:uncharacterized protein BCR37DRAFT_386424 [Protomyces lactucae-debilis]ORY84226.1 hypothetical protein BCR37DRAFT_386424 [Protomyces lactucae-debilis]
MSAPSQVTVTYEDPYGLAERFLPLLKSRLPLQQLHWKSLLSQQGTVKTIAQLDCLLVPHKNLPEQQHQYASVLDRPYLNLFLVQCDDAEAYKTVVRQQVRTWFSAVASKKDQEWMIIHCISASEANVKSGPKILGLRNSVLDRIRSDFNSNTSKRDQCCRINFAADKKDFEQELDDFVLEMKSCLMSSLDKRVQDHQDQISRMEAQRTLPGWNYCTYFILKEGLADTLENVSLYSDSLAILDELEVAFKELQESSQLEHFEAGSPTVQDADSALPDLSAKEYRQMIMQNKITVFDFSTYLFSRQVVALRHSIQAHDLLTRSLRFVTSMSRLFTPEHASSPWLAETWVLTTISSVLSQVEAMSHDESLASPRADLRALYRDTLCSLRDRVLQDEGLATQIPVSLRQTLILQADDYRQYLTDLTQSIIDDLQLSGRHNSAAVWVAQLARLHAANKEWPQVVALLSSIPESLSVLSAICDLYLTALRETGDTTTYLITILEHAKQLKSSSSSLSSDHIQEIATLAALDTTENVVWPTDDFLSVTLSKYPRTSLTSVEADLTIDWTLSIPFGIWDICATLKRDSGELMHLLANQVCLVPGRQVLTVSTNDIRAGNYALESITFSMGRLSLLQADEGDNIPFLIPIFSHPGLDMSLHRPRLIHVRHSDPAVVIRIRCSSTLQVCTLQCIRSLQNEIDWSKAVATEIESGTPFAVSVQDDKMTFAALPASSTIECLIPFTGPKSQSTRLAVKLDYLIDGQRSSWQTDLSTSTALPLAVDVQDYFRAGQLVSNFKVGANTDASFLLSESSYTGQQSGEMAESPKYKNIFVGPQQATQLVFKIPANPSSKMFDLDLCYRSLEEELLTASRSVLLDLGNEVDAPGEVLGSLWSILQEHLPRQCDMSSSVARGVFDLRPLDESSIHEELVKVHPSHRSTALKLLLAVFSHTYNVAKEGNPATLRISVDYPLPAVVHTIAMTPESTTAVLNRYLSAELSIVASTAWAAEQRVSNYWFEVEVDESQWVYAGQRRGMLVLQDGQFEATIGLIPLTMGFLTLPRVEVFSLEPDAVNEMHQKSGQIQVVSDREAHEQTVQLGLMRTVVAV